MSDHKEPTRPASASPLIQLLSVLTTCYIVSFTSSELSFRSLSDYYPMLQLPAWAIPAWAFNPIWTVVYGCMGIAGWFALRSTRGKRTAKARTASACLFVVQLFLGGAWAWLFFGLRGSAPAAIEGIAYLFVAAMTLWTVSRYESRAALLLTPPFLWSLYATILSFAVWRLNR